MNHQIAKPELKRVETNKPVSASKTSLLEAEEEFEDLLPSTSSSTDVDESEEKERILPRQDQVEDLKLPPTFQIRRPITRSTSKLGPLARPKL